MRVRLDRLLTLFATFHLVASTELVVPVRPPGAIAAITLGHGDWFATLSAAHGPNSVVQIWTLPGAVQLRTMPAPEISQIAASPTRAVIALVGFDSIDLLDVDTGVITPLKHQLPDLPGSVVWSPDGKFLFAGRQRLLKVNAATGQLEGNVAKLPAGEIVAMQFISHGEKLLVALQTGSTSMVLVYNTANWQELARFEGTNGALVMAVDRTESTLATIGSDRKLRLWSLTENRAIAPPFEIPAQALSMVFSGDGKSIAIHTSADGFRLFDLSQKTLGANFSDFRPLSGPVQPDYAHNAIVSGDAEGDVFVLDGTLKSVVREARAGLGSTALDAAFTRDGILAVVGPRQKLAGIFVRTGAWMLGQNVESAIAGFDHPIGVLERRKGVDGPYVVLCDAAGLVIRNTLTREQERFETVPWADRISADGRWAAGWDGTRKNVKLFDTVDQSERTIVWQDNDPVIALSPAGNAVAVFSANGKSAQVRLWSLPDAKELPPFDPTIESERDGQPVLAAKRAVAMAFSPDGNRLAVLHGDGRTRVWDIAGGRKETTFDTPIGSLGPVAFTPDGKSLAVGGNGNTVSILALDGSVSPQTINMPAQPDFLKFRDDGQLLLVGTAWNGLSIYDLASKSLRGSVDLRSPDGPWIASTASGFFDGSEETWKDLLWRFNGQTFQYASASQYFGDFFYPGLFGKILTGAVPQPSASLDAVDRHVGSLALHLASKPAAGSRTVELEIAAHSSGNEKLQDVRLFRNGELVHQWDGAAPDRLRATFRLEAGPNSFEAYGFNPAKVRSEPAALTLEGAAALRRPGSLHVLAVGIDNYAVKVLKLNFAVNDARMIAAVLRGGRSELTSLAAQLSRQDAAARNTGSDYRDDRLSRFVAASGPADVTVLSEQTATKTGILNAIREIAGKSLPEDAFVLFFAGHGMADGKSYYLFPQDVKFSGFSPGEMDATRHSAISDRDLANALAELDVAASAMIIDACESGQAVQSADDWRRGPIDAQGLAQLAYEKDMYLLAAAQSNQSATELGKLRHGLLTWALVDEALLNGKAIPGTGDGLELGNWLSWAAWRVPLLDTETLNVKRGIHLVGEQPPAVRAPAGQQPTLLARRRPGATPLVITPFTLDIDPVTLTTSGTASPIRQAPRNAAPPPFLVPDSNPGNAVSLAISPNRDWLIVAEQSGRVRIRRLPDLLAVRDFPVPSLLLAAALSPDGKTLACLTPEPSLMLVDVAKGAVRNTFRGLSAESYQTFADIAWASDGRTLILSLQDAIRMVDSNTGKIVKQVEGRGMKAIGESPGLLVSATHGALIAGRPVGGDIQLVQLGGTTSEKPTIRKIGNHPQFQAGAYDPKRFLAASVGADRKLRFWDAQGSIEMGTAASLSFNPTAIAFQNGGFYIAADSGEIYSVAGPAASVKRVYRSSASGFDRIATAGNAIAAIGRDSLVWWAPGVEMPAGAIARDRVSQFAALRNNRLILSGLTVRNFADESGDLFSYVLGDDATETRTVANAGTTIQPLGSVPISDDGRSITAFDPAAMSPVATFPVRAATAAISSDLSRMAWCVAPVEAAGGRKPGYRLFVADKPAFQARQLAVSETGGCGAMRWLPSALAMRDSPLQIGLHPLTSGNAQTVAGQGAEFDAITAFAFDPKGESVAVATNARMDLVAASDNSRIRKLPSTNLGLAAQLAFSADGRQLAAAGREGGLMLLKLEETDTIVVQLEELSGFPAALTFSEDGRFLAALSTDGKCQIYRTSTGGMAAKVSLVGGSADWFVETPDGRFDAPQTAWSRVQRRDGDRLVALNEKRDGYTPGLLASVLRGN